MNRELGKGLKSRAIPTPHFHKVDKQGFMLAYQTATLVKSHHLVQDVGTGIDLFCKESNVVAQGGAAVLVAMDADDLGLQMDDPSQSINFYP